MRFRYPIRILYFLSNKKEHLNFIRICEKFHQSLWCGCPKSDEEYFEYVIIVFVHNESKQILGSEDPFKYLKQFVKDATARHANDDVKMSWLSIRLPESKKVPIQLEDKKALNFAIVDLSLKKIGLDSLTLVLDVWANITVDFLNRVSWIFWEFRRDLLYKNRKNQFCIKSHTVKLLDIRVL